MKWPRYAEMFLAMWLIASVWVLERPDAAVPLLAGAVILALDVISIARPERYVYLGIIAVALGLLAYAYVFAPPEAAATQSDVIVALSLLMFAILPTEATRPPDSWRRFQRSSTRDDAA